jgi:predicted peptidase
MRYKIVLTRFERLLSIALLVAASGVVLFAGIKLVRANANVSAAGPALPNPATPVKSYGYTMHVFTDAQGHSLTYYLYVPDHYTPQKKYPLVLILHGGGERSSPKNTLAQNQQAILRQQYVQVWSSQYSGPDNPDIQQQWPSFVVVPQIALDQQWVNVNVHQGSYTQTAQPSTSLLLSKELLDALQQQYSGIDADRLYVTGLSLGGYGTWDAIERWPNYFAAAVPLAGAGDPSKAAELVNMPIWAFHGSVDDVVPVAAERAMISAIKAAGGNPRYTEFKGVSHIIWGYVYSTPGTPTHVAGFYNWLFSQHRG